MFSQNINQLYTKKEDLIHKRKYLVLKKKTIENQIDSINNSLLLIENEIAIQNQLENATKALLKRDSNLFKLPSEKTEILETINQKEQLYLIEYYEYGKYYKAIYNNKIGYVKEDDILKTKLVNSLKKKTNNNSSSHSSQNKSSYSDRHNSPKSYVTNICGALTKSGNYCKRKVKGVGHCYQH
ncbi:hypothetical protein [Cellulophaga omnivescoria]|nr:hypothetical protein [Cellulophaga omnivescoria]WBU90464.1 hypothetical protein PBN93_05480 [Cellulophaga omnivescoria]WKB82584.1 hypothetical protein QYR09_06010 [Cellulophaga lytica]